MTTCWMIKWNPDAESSAGLMRPHQMPIAPSAANIRFLLAQTRALTRFRHGSISASMGKEWWELLQNIMRSEWRCMRQSRTLTKGIQ
jgi:hypothetical protein